MSYFDDASLVMIPSGYKTSKVYSVKPTDGSGDLTFSRSNDTATRVGPNGLIEKVRTNLFLNSNNFSSGSWTNNDFTLTSGQADPFGGTNAWKAQSTSAIQADLRQIVTGAGTFSIYAKAGSFGYIALWNGSTGVSFDLINGTVGAAGKITSVGNGWYRCSVPTSSTGSVTLIPYINSAVGDYIYIYAAQAEAGDIATDYIATTSATVSVGPVANVPRLDYLNSSCPRLILEGQRTNLATYSEQADQYIKAGSTIGSNVLTSPDGYTNADSIIEDGNTSPHAFYNFALTTFTASTYTLSVFAKKGGRDWIRLSIYDGVGNLSAYFNLNTGVIGTTSSATAKIEDYGNGWYRCSITATVTAASGGFAIYAAYADNVDTYAGTNGLAAAYFYGWQLELGAYATSYIPTLGAAVTRGADAASKTGISSLIGQTAGTIYAEWTANNVSTSGRIIAIGDGSFDNRIVVLEDGNSVRVFIATSNVVQADLSPLGNYVGTHKIAVAYANNDLKVYIDGVAVATGTTLSVPPCSVLYVGTFEDGTGTTPLGGRVAQALLFKTRLTNAQLAELTTL